MNRTLFMLAAAVLYPCIGYSQFQDYVFRQYDEASVLVSGNAKMRMPWTGGVNNPTIAMADLNQDGRKDVVLFEDGSGIKTLIATGNGVYKYNSKYEGSFPKSVMYFVLFADFNRDNISDLCTYYNNALSVRYGEYKNAQLHFKQAIDVRYELPGSGMTNAYVRPWSIPGLVDIDGDDDIDIISYDAVGNALTFYRNCGKDENLPADSIKICLKTMCWGRTQQYNVRKQVLGYVCSEYGATCKGCGNRHQKTTDGSHNLCFIDIDNDGDFDYFDGHESFSDIQVLYNGKNKYGVDSVIAQDTVWKSNGVTMIMPQYPAAFALDVDHDNDEDLLFTPRNAKTEDYNSVAWFENTGNKNFVHRKNNLLVEDMIDMGRTSYPVFYDYDKDGRKDLFVGSVGFYQYPANYNRAKIAFYRNTTTVAGSYSFELITNDFLGLWAKDYRGTSLAIGDLNNDSLDDLVIGHVDGTFSFYKNTAASDTSQPVWVLETDELKDQSGATIDVGDYATPAIYDVDADGKKDLVSGNNYGALYYFDNRGGVPGTVSLQKVTDKLGNIVWTDPYEPTPFTTPYFGPMDNTGIDYLVIGTNKGRIYRFDGFQNGAMPPNYTMIDSVYSHIEGDMQVAPAFANLDNDQDNLYEMVLGNMLGGLVFYKQYFKVSVDDQATAINELTVYPNPAGDILNINWGINFNHGGVSVQLVSVMGQVVSEESFNEKRVGCTLDISEVRPGMYYCIVRSGDKRLVRPVSVVK